MTAVLIARFYLIIVCCLIMLIAMVTTYMGRAQNPAWLLIEFIQLLLLMPMLNHVTPRALLWVLEGIRFLSFDFETFSSLQLPIWEPSIISKASIP